MKRLLVLCAVLAICAIIVLPGWIGRQLAVPLGQAVTLNGLLLEPQSVTTGWFATDAGYRLTVTDPALAAPLNLLLPGLPPAARPTMLARVRLVHGPWPFLALASDGIPALPVLVVAGATLTTTDGRPLPAVIAARVGLDGELHLAFRQSSRRVSTAAGWQVLEFDWHGSRDGKLRSLGLRVTGLDVPGLQIDEAALAIDSRRNEQRSELGIEYRQTGLHDGEQRIDATLDATLNGLDPVALGALLDTLAASDDPFIAWTGAAFDAGLRRLAARGGRLRIDDFMLSLSAGAIRATASIDLPATLAADWPALLLAASGNLEARVDGALLGLGSAYRPTLAPLLAGGYLLPADDDYCLRIAVADGKLTINGAPMPLPASHSMPVRRSSSPAR